jgi:tetratricopeptide (TPR) repeat protein
LYHVRARVAFERGLPEAARRDLQQALRIRPGHAVDLELLARTHARCARWALAIESYQRAADAGLDTAELHLGLARAYLNRRILLGEITVMRLAGAEPGTLVDGGYVLEPAAGDDHVFRVCPPASAIYHLVAARIRGATGPTIDVLEADIWLEAGFYNRARTLYAKAETDRSDAQAAEFYERYARACLRIGHVDQGLRLLRTAVRLDPEACRSVLVDAHLEVSRHASIDGDFKLALYHLRQAVASNPDSPELHRRLGDAYARQRDHVRANEHWHKVLLLDPDHADRAALLEKIRRSANGGRNSDEP